MTDKTDTDPAVEAGKRIVVEMWGEPDDALMYADIIRTAYAEQTAERDMLQEENAAMDKRIVMLETEAECEICDARLDANMPGVCLDCYNRVQLELSAKDKRIEAYAQRDKAWAELAERAYVEGYNKRGVSSHTGWLMSDAKTELDNLKGE